jgi:hypothetical protein
MERLQEVPLDPALDRTAPDAGRKQLRAGDNPVLPARERSDHLIRRTFATCGVVNVRLDRHAAIVAIRALRITTRTANSQSPSSARRRVT